MKLSKVLIAGTRGVIGNHVTRLYLLPGDGVRAMVLPGDNRASFEGMNVEFVEGKLLDPGSLNKAIGMC